MRRDVRATNPALMGATVLEAPHCRQYLQSQQVFTYRSQAAGFCSADVSMSEIREDLIEGGRITC